MVDVPAQTARGASNDQTRRHNLSMILKFLHADGAQPRSQLTARTGLNRSTVAALVAELVEHRLVFETQPDPTKMVGRPSPIVRVDPTTVAIAVNPEVDAVTLGIVGLSGKVHRRIRHDLDHVPTPQESVTISADLIQGLRDELREHRVVGVGVAVPALVRAGDGLVRWAPHLQWRDAPVAKMLSEATGLPVWAGNDATLGAIAEGIFGAGRGKSELVYLNGGASGIGGGVIANGVPVGGAGGYAGEFGHIRVDGGVGSFDDPEAGSLESKVNRAELLAVLGLTAADSEQLDEALLASTDPRVAEVVRNQLDYLSISLRNAVNVLNPQVIVLGGFLSSIFGKEPEFLRERVERQSLAPAWECATIERAALGAELLMIGAAELAFSGLLDDPVGACAALAPAQAAAP